MKTRTLLTAAAILSLGVVPVQAQQHQHGQGEAHGGSMGQGQMMHGMQGMHEMHGAMMGGGMMQMMHAQPAAILEAADALALTPEQTGRLEALRDQAAPEHQQHMQAAMEAHRTAAAALEGDSPDLDAYAAALNEAADHMVMAHVAMTRTALAATEILTPEQREKLHAGMEAMHGGMMQGGAGAGHDGHH